jgi:hypothetical protein
MQRHNEKVWFQVHDRLLRRRGLRGAGGQNRKVRLIHQYLQLRLRRRLQTMRRRSLYPAGELL